MGLSCGIVGLPNVGKSTLFNALTNAHAASSNYPFCTIEPNIGIVSVPDERLDQLTQLVKPQKTVPAAIEFIDIAGLVKGASNNEGLGNQFLANIREVDAIVQVVRLFDDPDIVHVHGKVDPFYDLEVILTELILKDIETFEKRKAKTEKSAKSGNKEASKEMEVIENALSILNQGRILYKNIDFYPVLHDLRPLTLKPMLIAANMDEKNITRHEEDPTYQKLKEEAKKIHASVVPFCAKLEVELMELDAQEAKLLLKEYQLNEPGLNRIIREAYRLLNLMTYFTAGEKEVRAWTIPQGTKAPQAAGVIHSDFEKGFIKAEVVSYEDFIKAGGSFAKAKEMGKLRIEGKDYVFQDGDVVIFRFNV